MDTSDSSEGAVQQEKHGRMKMKWKPQEDQILADIVSWHGPVHWDSIAIHLPGRTGKQCRERWITFLSPDVKRDEWTKEEDEILIRMQGQYGNQWALMTKYLPGRSSISIKNRFKSLLRHGLMTNQSQYHQIISQKGPNLNRSSIKGTEVTPQHSEIQLPVQQLVPQTRERFIFDFPLPQNQRLRLF